MVSKKEIRKEILARRDALSPEEREKKSKLIATRVMDENAFLTADKILMFSSFKSEVDTTDIYKKAKCLNKDIYYPRVLGNVMEFYLVDEKTEWETSKFGVREPKIEEQRKLKANINDKIFVLMPGAVFDKNGNRIGYGGGYYDKYLQQLEATVSPQNLYKAAVAFECQIVEVGVIEQEMHDIKPDCIVTETYKYHNFCKH